MEIGMVGECYQHNSVRCFVSIRLSSGCLQKMLKLSYDSCSTVPRMEMGHSFCFYTDSRFQIISKLYAMSCCYQDIFVGDLTATLNPSTNQCSESILIIWNMGLVDGNYTEWHFCCAWYQDFQIVRVQFQFNIQRTKSQPTHQILHINKQHIVHSWKEPVIF